jgi:fumarate reductase subunit C
LKNYTIELNKNKKSRMPARLDLLQSLTGLILGLFIWVHILLDSSIIFGEAAFSFVSRNLEFAFLSDTGHGYPAAVFVAVLIIFTLFIIHAVLGVRKIPISWKQHRIIVDQMQGMKHGDTNLWYIQVVTGIIMFFAGSTHLYVIMANPGTIDPYLSADRMVSGAMWPLYLVLLISVGFHACIGLYRLMLKWDLFKSKNPKNFRQKLKKIRNIATIAFLCIGLIALVVFIVIGTKHKDHAGERYNKIASEHAAAAHAPAESGQASEEESEHGASHDSGSEETHTPPSDTHEVSDGDEAQDDSHSEEAVEQDSHDSGAEGAHEQEADTHEASHGDEAQEDSHSEEAVEQDLHDSGAEDAHEQEADTHEASHGDEAQDDSQSEEAVEQDSHDSGAEGAHEQEADTHEASHGDEAQDDSHFEEAVEQDSHDSGAEGAHEQEADTHEASHGDEAQNDSHSEEAVEHDSHDSGAEGTHEQEAHHDSDAETGKEDHGHQTDSHTTKHP